MSDLSHIDGRGRARMVDVGGKEPTERRAKAEALVRMAPETLALIEDQAVPKGDVVAAARLAGIMAAKRTPDLIPLCHPLELSAVEVEIDADRELPGLRIVTDARLTGRTGVEMEALVAASVAALTIYDMCKAVDRGMEVVAVRLLEKSGGRSGTWRRDAGLRNDAPHGSRRSGRGTGGVPGRRARGERGGDDVSHGKADGHVVSVNVAATKGVQKEPQAVIALRPEHGVEGDGHAGTWHRQVSLLANESVETMRAKGLDVSPGAFGENITTDGIIVYQLPVGARLRIGAALLEVTQIGKVCHDRCAIYYKAGDCVMPREGIFARVLEGGELKAGDEIVVEKRSLIHAAVLTVSDKGSRGEREDESGAALAEALRAMGVVQVERAIVPDERDRIERELTRFADESDVNLVLTTGGTGFTERDVTPEATLAVLDRPAPGFAEAMRAGSLEKTPHAMLSRAVSGLRGRTLIINMPGSPRACREQFAMIEPALPHAIEKLLDLGGDCARPPDAPAPA